MDEIRKKKILYRANYRGFREADKIIGGFAKIHIHELTEEELTQFEQLLQAKDHDIYGWITEQLPVPSSFNTQLLKKIRAFKPKF